LRPLIDNGIQGRTLQLHSFGPKVALQTLLIPVIRARRIAMSPSGLSSLAAIQPHASCRYVIALSSLRDEVAFGVPAHILISRL